ncbi:hypothetical protein ABW21_db0206616 [Orbilia brochopaga]|nr:hypothetical protein ABW21_db0206616 [Drechslerella brochopaga]
MYVFIHTLAHAHKNASGRPAAEFGLAEAYHIRLRFGGIGKGIMIREIDALDGLCGRIVDKAGSQFRILNRRKGPAVWGPRAMIDRKLYKKYMQAELSAYPNLTVKEGSVADIIIDKSPNFLPNGDGHYGQVTGIKLESGEEVYTRHIVVTTGTFLSGEIHIGIFGFYEIDRGGCIGF